MGPTCGTGSRLFDWRKMPGGVTVRFKDGGEARASFVVGCDGNRGIGSFVALAPSLSLLSHMLNSFAIATG